MNRGRDQSLEIRLDDTVTFSLPLAGPAVRSSAAMVDLLVIAALGNLTGLLVMAFGLFSEDAGTFAAILLQFATGFGYFILMEWFGDGRTLGKRLFKLRTIDERGLPLAFSQVVMRNLLRLVDGLPLLNLAGGLTCFFSRRCQRIGDIAAGTVVIVTRRSAPPALRQLEHDGPNSFRQWPEREARLRQLTTPAEADLLAQALLRRDELQPESRARLYREIATHFLAFAPFPPEAVEHVPEEQILRNLLSSLSGPAPASAEPPPPAKP